MTTNQTYSEFAGTSKKNSLSSSDLFGVSEFVDAFKDRWEEIHEELLGYLLASIDCTEELIASSAEKDLTIWGIRYNHSDEVEKLKIWLENRFEYLDTVIPNLGR